MQKRGWLTGIILIIETDTAGLLHTAAAVSGEDDLCVSGEDDLCLCLYFFFCDLLTSDKSQTIYMCVYNIASSHE